MVLPSCPPPSSRQATPSTSSTALAGSRSGRTRVAEALTAGLRALADRGMDGVECYRPRNTAAEAEHIARTAAAHGLFVTGGSDWHGDWHGPLGDFAVDRDDVAAFLDAGGI
jgi:sugar phosphate isomerase/epimerase